MREYRAEQIMRWLYSRDGWRFNRRQRRALKYLIKNQRAFCLVLGKECSLNVNSTTLPKHKEMEKH